MLNEPLDREWIESLRPEKNRVDEYVPYATLIEPERTAGGTVENTGTIFLVNQECPFRCLMCDLWKNTTDQPVSAKKLVHQIEYALEKFTHELSLLSPGRFGDASKPLRSLKLYNSGNFFDRQAIPPAAHQPILDRLKPHSRLIAVEHLIIENHPKLIGEQVLVFGNQWGRGLEIAMGLETIHPEILPQLNKSMTLDDFARATGYLLTHGIQVRAFVLLKPPFLGESESLDWALRAIEWAFSIGVNCCAIIPVRTGNGALDRLEKLGHFSEPPFNLLESAMDEGLRIRKNGQRLFVDLWDAHRFKHCPTCLDQRIQRLNRINLSQEPETPVACPDCSGK